jgi:hypothetical protein
MRQQSPLPERPESQAGFTYKDPVSEGVYSFGTQEFLYWQCREAALSAINVWEMLEGALTKWARSKPDPTKLRLIQNYALNEINAYYTGQSVLFYIYKNKDNKITYTGASTDVVSHEVGHALLDAIRPDLWNSSYFEVAAFHEAFGDCIALLTALSDKHIRTSILPLLDSENFVETMGEDIADGIRRLFESIPLEDPSRSSIENATGPRQALNNLKWQLPEGLPPVGPPGELVSEIHSFSRVFTGCFYDTMRNIFSSLSAADEAALTTAMQTAGKLLIAGARSAPEDPRFLQSVGRAMVLADEQLNGGANRLAIRNAFARHNIALGSAAMLAPVAGLAGESPRLAAARGAVLSQETRKDLLSRIKASPDDKLDVTVLDIGKEKVAQAIHRREVPLGKLDKRLKGVSALATESVLVGVSGERAAFLGSLPEAKSTNDEVIFFVESLLRQNSILFDKPPGMMPGVKRGKGTYAEPEYSLPVTHAVRARGGKRFLTRIQFACWD